MQFDYADGMTSPPRISGMNTPLLTTSPTRYLGGMAALNLPSPQGTGDWHMVETFFSPNRTRSRSFISGTGCLTDTTPLLGTQGIYECTALVKSLQIPHEAGAVYAANHARAIADLVLAAVLRGESPDFVRLDDWMPRDSDKQEVFAMLATALSQLEHQQQYQHHTALQAWQTKNTP